MCVCVCVGVLVYLYDSVCEHAVLPHALGFFQLFANSQGEITVDVLGQILEYSLMVQ